MTRAALPGVKNMCERSEFDWETVAAAAAKRSVVIDHKTFPGPRPRWNEEALSYSGQLAAYAEALTKSGRTVAGVWIHFVVGGGLVKVEA